MISIKIFVDKGTGAHKATELEQFCKKVRDEVKEEAAGEDVSILKIDATNLLGPDILTEVIVSEELYDKERTARDWTRTIQQIAEKVKLDMRVTGNFDKSLKLR